LTNFCTFGFAIFVLIVSECILEKIYA